MNAVKNAAAAVYYNVNPILFVLLVAAAVFVLAVVFGWGTAVALPAIVVASLAAMWALVFGL